MPERGEGRGRVGAVDWEEVVGAQPGHRGQFQGVAEGDQGGRSDRLEG